MRVGRTEMKKAAHDHNIHSAEETIINGHQLVQSNMMQISSTNALIYTNTFVKNC